MFLSIRTCGKVSIPIVVNHLTALYEILDDGFPLSNIERVKAYQPQTTSKIRDERDNSIKNGNIQQILVLDKIRSNTGDLIMTIKSDSTVMKAMMDAKIQPENIQPQKQIFGDKPELSQNSDNLQDIKNNAIKKGEFEVLLLPNSNSKFVGLSLTSQLKVHDVESGSDAARAGIMVGDTVLAINDHPVTPCKHSEAFNHMRQGISNNAVKLRLLRNTPVEPNGKINSSLYPNSIWMVQDNPTIVTAYGTNVPCGRICQLNNLKPGANVGLSIMENVNKPHEILAIIPDSPAHSSALEVGDLIIGVNNVDVHNESFENVKKYIKEGQAIGKLAIEVIDPAVYSEIKDQLNTSNDIQHIDNILTRIPSIPPRDNKQSTDVENKNSLVSDTSDVILQRNRSGQYFVKSVKLNSKASKAGIRQDDIIVSVNKLKLDNFNNSEANSVFASEMLKHSVEILVRTNGQSDADCIITGENVSWKIHDGNNKDINTAVAFQSAKHRFTSEPEIHIKLKSKLSNEVKSASNVEGTVQDRNGHRRRRKLIQSIRKFCHPNGRKNAKL
ncbi:hypothetical protein GJ496_011509 [Pomphorhynchus laevis]|nr:hypothetical protein GJ496_011509 [Pomphorhynchus laevis]